MSSRTLDTITRSTDDLLNLDERGLDTFLYVSDLVDAAKADIKRERPHDPLAYDVAYCRVMGVLAHQLDNVIQRYRRDMGIFRNLKHS